VLGEPLEGDVDVDLVLGRDRVAAYFSVGDGLEIPVFKSNTKKKQGVNLDLGPGVKKKRWQTYIFSMTCSTVRAPGRSFLFPRTRMGIDASWGFSSRFLSSVLAASNLSWSTESTTKLRMCMSRQRCKKGHSERALSVHNRVDATAVTLPHASETGLTADIPQLHGHVALGDLAHVETDGGDHVLGELAVLR